MTTPNQNQNQRTDGKPAEVARKPKSVDVPADVFIELLRILGEIAETRSNPYHHQGIDAPAWGKLKDFTTTIRQIAGDIAPPAEIIEVG